MIYKNAINEQHVGNSHVYQADCMDLLKQTPDKYYDLCVCDPPYGIDINMNMGRKKGKKKKHEEKGWDAHPPNEDYFKELFRVSRNQIIWGGNYFHLPLTKSWIFWDKAIPDGVSFADGELAWTSFDRTLVKAKVNYYGFNGKDSGIRIHPTQKPVKLYDWIFKNYAKEGDKVLDTHLGSQSSRIAAHKAKLDFVGCELDPDYFRDGNKRFNDFISQTTLF